MCGQIYCYLANFREQNPVISIEIHAIGNFVWGQNISQQDHIGNANWLTESF